VRRYDVGTLWRSAWQLGAGFIFTVATRFKYEASDTTQVGLALTLHHVTLQSKQQWMTASEIGGVSLHGNLSSKSNGELFDF
jgi:hypothetical protein